MTESIFRAGLLAGKVALVTGGSSGINKGIAQRFLELGDQVDVGIRRRFSTRDGAMGAQVDDPGRTQFRPVCPELFNDLAPLHTSTVPYRGWVDNSLRGLVARRHQGALTVQSEDAAGRARAMLQLKGGDDVGF